ncbi:hypothetical protein [Serinibacter arcticus]|uniref:hypothetical protein n=1 Tax=Serinibacter arcticus TaxID=1655435 RepID=UPI001F3C759B|nr:hypothetical protein [Serinibacter arcticus]
MPTPSAGGDDVATATPRPSSDHRDPAEPTGGATTTPPAAVVPTVLVPETAPRPWVRAVVPRPVV